MSGEMRTVTDLRAPLRGSKRRAVWLDGELWRTMSVDLVRDLDIHVGDILDIEQTGERASAREPELARMRALRLLAHHDRSASELRRRLDDDGYPADISRLTVADLMATELVDDDRFAGELARSLVVIRHLGRTRAAREMSAKGVPEDLAAAALDALAPADAEHARVRAEAVRALRSGDTPERLASRLVRRGFASHDALEAARQVVPSQDGDSALD